MQPSYQDEPLANDWFERFVALHEGILGLTADEVRQRITRIPLVELLLLQRPDGQWEARLPQLQLNVASIGPTPDIAIEGLIKLFGSTSEHIEGHPLFILRHTPRAVDYLQRSVPPELKQGPDLDAGAETAGPGDNADV